MPIKLNPHEHVVTAWAEPARGSGWDNRPLWVLIYGETTGRHRVECIQPDKQTAEMRTLYDVSDAASRGMTAAVKAMMGKGKP